MSIAVPGFSQTGLPQQAFLRVSEFLTGRLSLDPDQAARLYAALLADMPDFEAKLGRLLAWIGEHGMPADEVQRALDGEGAAFAPLPRQIVTAWYLGTVGEGARALAVTFETSLMHEVVADRLRPPSACYGPHGSWSEPPI